MELKTINFTQDDEIMTKISLIDCGKVLDTYMLYNSAEETRAKPDLQKTVREIQYFIERIYEYGRKGVPISFSTIEVPLVDDIKY